MKKINFVSGFGAKFAVAAFAVAGLTLTSCEKEDFDVNVPNINIKVPTVDFEDGKAYLILTVTSTSGNDLTGVTFTSTDGKTYEAGKSYEFTESTTFQVTAAKTGYLSVTKTVVVPVPAKGSVTTIPVEFVLTAETSDVTIDIPETPDPTTIPDDKKEEIAPVETTITNGANLQAGTHTVNAAVPAGTKYTIEQIAALYDAVNAMTVVGTKASADDEAAANLEKAKELLRAQIAALPTEWNTVSQPVTYTLSDQASALTLEVTTVQFVSEVTLKATVASKEYSVKGEGTTVLENKTRVINPQGVDVSHNGHGHGHGDNGNAGGGTGE